MDKKTALIGVLASLFVVTLVVAFSQYQHIGMIEQEITTGYLSDSVTITPYLHADEIDLREIELVIDGERRRFAIGEIKNDDKQPGGGRLPMVFVYNGSSRVAKVVTTPFGQ